MCSAAGPVDLLRSGAIEILGLLPYASNYTFLARVGGGGGTLAVYKPRRGERPLWDFEHGSLAAREAAAFVVSDAGDWGLVPATVLRDDAPLGPGSLQLFVEHDPDRHFFALEDERRDDFRAFASFDAVINNADRKAGHVLEGGDGRLWAVDHGVSFHTDPKLRTVIWTFADEPLAPGDRERLERLRSGLHAGAPTAEDLEPLLSPPEIDALRRRVDALLSGGVYPRPQGTHPLPWPLL